MNDTTSGQATMVRVLAPAVTFILLGAIWQVIAVGLLPTSAEAPRATVAVRPEEHVVPVTVPFAQYVKLSEVALPVGVYVNVPFLQMPATVFCGCALQVSVPFSGAMRSVTP